MVKKLFKVEDSQNFKSKYHVDSYPIHNKLASINTMQIETQYTTPLGHNNTTKIKGQTPKKEHL